MKVLKVAGMIVAMGLGIVGCQSVKRSYSVPDVIKLEVIPEVGFSIGMTKVALEDVETFDVIWGDPGWFSPKTLSRILTASFVSAFKDRGVEVYAGRKDKVVSVGSAKKMEEGSWDITGFTSSQKVESEMVNYGKDVARLIVSVNYFDMGETLDKSYIDLSIKVINDGTGKVIWAGRVRGYYEDVVDAVADAFVHKQAKKGGEASAVPFPVPAVKLSVEPLPFSPDGDGKNDILFFVSSVNSKEPVKSWKLTIYSPMGSKFKVFRGSKFPPKRLKWDGKSDTGELVQSAMTYRGVLEVENDKGGVGKAEVKIPVDILVFKKEKKEGTKKKEELHITLSAIEFEFNSAKLKPGTEKILDKLVQILKSYPNYKVKIIGHTDNVGTDVQNMKLSLERAKTVKNYLVSKGISAKRLSIEGRGSKEPVASNDTEEGRAKNRRVEFILEKG